jgi:hypothetical protein
MDMSRFLSKSSLFCLVLIFVSVFLFAGGNKEKSTVFTRFLQLLHKPLTNIVYF